jgi:hypothetical protein
MTNQQRQLLLEKSARCRREVVRLTRYQEVQYSIMKRKADAGDMAGALEAWQHAADQVEALAIAQTVANDIQRYLKEKRNVES